jgi:sigma-54 dependent transcriptional regulator, acetoin dehydrogenase operon transcriptional activator AcoR
MAAKFAESYSGDNFEIISVSDNTEMINPIAIKVMKEISSDMPERATNISDVLFQEFDVVVTLCLNLEEDCPHFPGSPARIHWGFMDPSRFGKDKLTEYYRRLRDAIKDRINGFFEHGYLRGLLGIRKSYGQILNNITDGVVAHDSSRKIYFFNHAAEEITGYKYKEVIGRDCHIVLPDNLCGLNCSFCNAVTEQTESLHYSAVFTRKDGAKRDLEISLVSLYENSEKNDGAVVLFRDKTEINRLKNKVAEGKSFEGIIGSHPSMQYIYSLINDLANVNIPVLIEGESGTGKEMVAKAIHNCGQRKKHPFIPVDCGALPEGLLESELFGHVKGAFTGAIRGKKGRFELADKGILFLDEIGEVPLSIQAKLLRVIQEKQFVPVGGEKAITVDIRLICATNRDLKQMTKEGLFREDLFYRLAVIPVKTPPLRDRPTDVPYLLDHFMEIFSSENQIEIKSFSADALNSLVKYAWPGNVRELANSVQYSLIKCNGPIIHSSHLPPEIADSKFVQKSSVRGRKPKLNISIVQDALNNAEGNKVQAAKDLGVSRTTLYRYIDEELD